MTLSCVLVAGSGCESPKPTPPSEVQSPEDHVHHHGPNGGELIELSEGSDEEFHAELVHDTDEGIVTVYLLDKDAEKAVPTAANEAIIRITLDDKATEFHLPARPKEGEAAGNSSKFESNDQSLSLALRNEKATRELEVKIGEKLHKQKVPYYEPHHVGAAHSDQHGLDGENKSPNAK
ncbi:MAG: hypothetical protein IT427_05645 [Pirellulales bacterium]|nr:hypothetical protein [Pirellulales bacterium]